METLDVRGSGRVGSWDHVQSRPCRWLIAYPVSVSRVKVRVGLSRREIGMPTGSRVFVEVVGPQNGHSWECCEQYDAHCRFGGFRFGWGQVGVRSGCQPEVWCFVGSQNRHLRECCEYFSSWWSGSCGTRQWLQQ